MIQTNDFIIKGFHILQYKLENSKNNEPCDVELIIGPNCATTVEVDDVIYRTSKGNYPIEFHKKESGANGVRILLFGADEIKFKKFEFEHKPKNAKVFVYTEKFIFQDSPNIENTLTILQSFSEVNNELLMNTIVKEYMNTYGKYSKCVEYVSNHYNDIRILLIKNI